MPTAAPLDELVRDDHAAARALFQQFHAARNTDRAQAFEELHAALIAHEVAEEVVVLPALAVSSPSVRNAADERIAEQGELASMLARLARLGTEDWRFDSLFAELEERFYAHMGAEEDQLLPALRGAFDEGELDRLGRKYRRAKEAKGRPSARLHDPGAHAEAEHAHDAIAVTAQRGAR